MPGRIGAIVRRVDGVEGARTDVTHELVGLARGDALGETSAGVGFDPPAARTPRAPHRMLGPGMTAPRKLSGEAHRQQRLESIAPT